MKYILAFLLLASAAWGQTDIVIKVISDAGYVLDGTNNLPICSMIEFHSNHFFDTAKRFGAYTNIIRELASSGEICKVIGHQWAEPHVCVYGWGERTWTRECGLCGKQQDGTEQYDLHFKVPQVFSNGIYHSGPDKWEEREP